MNELRTFLSAVMFYTRIPISKFIDHDPKYLKKSARYFTLIGWIVGAIGAGIFFVTYKLFSFEIALLLSMASTIRITGAFHEDGFADVCDGFGGGWAKDKILTIMKDSRLGTFGVIGLILLLSLKFFALYEISAQQLPLIIIAGHVLSRMVSTRMLARGKYVQNNNITKAGSAAVKLKSTSLLVNGSFGMLVFLLFENWLFVVVLIPMYLVEYLLYRFYKKWIGGYNGDCVGTVQQLSELVFYLSMIVLWKFI